jgi:hypothetical protein
MVCAGLVAQRAKVCIASFEMPARRTLYRMLRQVSGRDALNAEFARGYLATVKDHLWLYDHVGQTTPDKLLAVIRWSHDKKGIQHFVIDSFLTCGLPEDGNGALTAQKEFIGALCTIARDTTHSVLIPELCETLPLVDLFYKRMLNFVYRCLNSQSSLVKFVTRFGILSGQMDSVVGRNVLNCSLRYNTNIDRILKMEFAPHKINRHAAASQVDLDISALLLELLQCRDGSLMLSNDNFNSADIAAMIDFLCTGRL